MAISRDLQKLGETLTGAIEAKAGAIAASEAAQKAIAARKAEHDQARDRAENAARESARLALKPEAIDGLIASVELEIERLGARRSALLTERAEAAVKAGAGKSAAQSAIASCDACAQAIIDAEAAHAAAEAEVAIKEAARKVADDAYAALKAEGRKILVAHRADDGTLTFPADIFHAESYAAKHGGAVLTPSAEELAALKVEAEKQSQIRALEIAKARLEALIEAPARLAQVQAELAALKE